MARIKKEAAEAPPPGSALELALHAVKKQFGDGVAWCPGDTPMPGIEWIPSSSLALDEALGGGYPRGRIVEIYGPETSGKTTLALHAIANTQRQGLTCAFIDAEHALDGLYAETLGVQMDKLILSQPDSGEQALEVFDIFARSGAFGIIVLDSVAALVPQAELEGDMGDSHMGLQARLMSQAMRKLTGGIHKSNTLAIFINQTRSKIGVMYGNPETVAGGNALKFYASQRLRISKKEEVKDGDQVVAILAKVKVVKNKVARPYREAEFRITFGVGVDTYYDLVTLGESYGILEKAGSWYKYEGNSIGQGQDTVIAYLKEHPEVCQLIRDKVLE